MSLKNGFLVFFNLHFNSFITFRAGFSPYTELTYPISTQTIITNGQFFSFYAYQLNTCALYQRFSGDVNPRRNVCFSTDEMKLFECVENGQVQGETGIIFNQFNIHFFSVYPTSI